MKTRWIGGAMMAVLLPFLAACQTTQKEAWTEWKDITVEQSLVRVVWPPDVDPVKIKRQARSERYKYIKQEYWNWGSGEAFLNKLPGNMYSRLSTRDSNILSDVIDQWKHLAEAKLEIDDSQVKRGVNKVGIYFYAASDKSDTGETCFVFHQALPLSEQSGYETERNASGGRMSAYECQAASKISVEQMRAMMLPFVEEIRMR